MEVPLLRQDGQLCSFSHLKLCNSKLLKNIMHLAVILGTSGISALASVVLLPEHTQRQRERESAVIIIMVILIPVNTIELTHSSLMCNSC